MEKKDFEYAVYIIGILFGAFVISEILRWLIKRFANIKAEKLRVDPTHYSFLKNATSFVVYSVALGMIIYSVPGLKAVKATLFASAGIFAAIIALASQQAFSNIISGIFIVTAKPFRVGDYIEISVLHRGTVEDITLRHTVIRDIQNSRIIVPNSKINSETIVNYHLNDERKKEKIEYIIDIESNVDTAINIIREEIKKHPDYVASQEEENIDEELTVRLVKIENGTVTLRALVGSEDPDKAYEIHCDLNYSIKKRFDLEGVNFAKRTLITN
ncbi:MAG: mechanosensitive ion channel family protein [Bacteroidia bacterium]